MDKIKRGKEAALRLSRKNKDKSLKLALLMFAWGCAPTHAGHRAEAGSVAMDGSIVRRRQYGSGDRRKHYGERRNKGRVGGQEWR